jgi:hypothetical protein
VIFQTNDKKLFVRGRISCLLCPPYIQSGAKIIEKTPLTPNSMLCEWLKRENSTNFFQHWSWGQEGGRRTLKWPKMWKVSLLLHAIVDYLSPLQMWYQLPTLTTFPVGGIPSTWRKPTTFGRAYTEMYLFTWARSENRTHARSQRLKRRLLRRLRHRSVRDWIEWHFQDGGHVYLKISQNLIILYLLDPELHIG